MTGKARLTSLASKLKDKPSTQAEGLVANPPHGEKGDFVKITVTLPPEVYQLIAAEVTRRKVKKEPNPQISAILREAAVQYLGGPAG